LQIFTEQNNIALIHLQAFFFPGVRDNLFRFSKFSASLERNFFSQ